MVSLVVGYHSKLDILIQSCVLTKVLDKPLGAILYQTIGFPIELRFNQVGSRCGSSDQGGSPLSILIKSITSIHDLIP